MKKWLLCAVAAQLVSWAGVLDTTFNPGTGANGIVEQVLPLSNGKILVCGNFTVFNGQSKGYIARLNSNGSVDTTFNAQPSYWVRNMSVQGDGKVIIGGFFKSVQGIPRNLIARLNADGSIDTTFNPGSGMTDLIAGGIDGNVDPFVFWTAVQSDGKILATGNFRNYNGAGSVGLVRINPDGSRDTSFNVGQGFDSWGRSIRIQSNGQIVVSGWFSAYNGQWANRLVRINGDGSRDGGFNPFFGDRTAIYSTVGVGDKMVVAGHSLNTEGLFLREMERINADGSLDSSFVGYTNEKTESLAQQGDGKIIAGGYFTAANGVRRTSLARFNPDGTLDTGWSAEIDNYIWSVALQADGKALISGGFYSVDGTPRGGVARLLTGATGTPPPPPSAVAPILSAAANSSSQITLTWSDSATDRTGYVVERKTGAGGTYAGLVALGAATRSYVNSGLAAGTQYYYRLRASRSNGTTIYSNESAATTSAPPGGEAAAGVRR